MIEKYKKYSELYDLDQIDADCILQYEYLLGRKLESYDEYIEIDNQVDEMILEWDNREEFFRCYPELEKYRRIYLTIEDIVRRLNDGIERTDEEIAKCKEWLIEYKKLNNYSMIELDDLCFENSDWVFENIFG